MAPKTACLNFTPVIFKLLIIKLGFKSLVLKMLIQILVKTNLE